MPVPVGAVTTMVPVATVQVGCDVTDAVGVAGVPELAVNVTDLTGEIHPALLFAVTL